MDVCVCEIFNGDDIVVFNYYIKYNMFNLSWTDMDCAFTGLHFIL